MNLMLNVYFGIKYIFLVSSLETAKFDVNYFDLNYTSPTKNATLFIRFEYLKEKVRKKVRKKNIR